MNTAEAVAQRFETPQPVTLEIDIAAGEVRVMADSTSESIVEVHPLDPTRRGDIEAADQTRVEFQNGRLSIVGPRQRRMLERPGSVSVSVQVPAQSSLSGKSSVGDLVVDGPMGACSIRTSAGELRVESVTEADLHTSAGAVTLLECAGRATVKTAAGDVRIGHLGGRAEVSTSAGEVRVERAESDLEVKTSAGRIDVLAVVKGRVKAKTAFGNVRVGVAQGTAAHLDLSSSLGRIINEMTPSEGPGAGQESVQLEVRTNLGDVCVYRA